MRREINSSKEALKRSETLVIATRKQGEKYEKESRVLQKRIDELEKDSKADRDRKKVLNDKLKDDKTSENEKIDIKKEIENIDSRVDEREIEIEGNSLKSRVKIIFKKYGLTISSVLTAAGVVISTIALGLSAGLSKMVKGVGNCLKKVGKGLKDIGKKLAQILPGMIGAIASFIFKTAGEAIGFLAKNAW